MEKDILDHSRDINQLAKRIEKMETKSEELITHPDNLSSDRMIRTEIREKKNAIYEQMEQMSKDMQQHQTTMAKLSKAKDKAFEMIREMQRTIEIINDEMTINDKHILNNRNSLNILSSNMSDQQRDNRDILKRLEAHEIKLNARGTVNAKPWAKHSDIEKYPILQVYETNTHFSKLAPLLENIKLQGDDLNSIKQFWDSINAAIMTSLSTMKFLPEYDDLTHTFDPIDHLMPPPIHPQYNDANNAMKQYGTTIRLHMQKQSTFASHIAPKASILQQEQSLEKSGFTMMYEIIKSLSPQLGGEYRDMQQYVETLKIIDGEPVLEYYLRALRMSQEIQLQADNTGQNNRLIRRFVTQLFNIKSFTECMRPTMSQLQQFFRVPNNHLTQFPRQLKTIYEKDIKEKCAPLLITPNAKYTPPTPTVAKMNISLHPREAYTSNVNIEEVSREMDIHDPQINAARLSTNTTKDMLKSNSYTPTRCDVCGLTQKECHQLMKNIHDPTDPNKCCFRGPKFIDDKQLRETVMQYNLKNPGPPTHNQKSELTPTVSQQNRPPIKPNIPTPVVNKVQYAYRGEIATEGDVTNTTTSKIDTEEVDPIKAMIEKIEPSYQFEDLPPPTINMFKLPHQTPTPNESIPDKSQITGELGYCTGCDEFGKVGVHCYYCGEEYLQYNIHNYSTQEVHTEVKTSIKDDTERK